MGTALTRGMNMIKTINARKEMIDAVMKEFEQNRDPHYVIGFYSSLIRTLATDRQSSTDEVIRILKMYGVSK